MNEQILEVLTAIRDQNVEILRLGGEAVRLGISLGEAAAQRSLEGRALAADLVALKGDQERLGGALAADHRKISDVLADLNKLAEMRENNRLYMKKYRAKAKAENPNSVSLQETVSLLKENEREKEKSPPHPPIEKEGKDKEKHRLQRNARTCACTYACARVHVCACARGLAEYNDLPPVINVHEMPCLGMLLAFAHQRAHFYDDEFIHDFYQAMAVEGNWLDPKTGSQIRNWPAYFRAWRLNRDFMKQLRDPDRLPDARNPIQFTRHADNWRGTRKEDIGDVLG